MNDKATWRKFVHTVQQGGHWPHVATDHLKCDWLELVSVKYKVNSENSGYKKRCKIAH